MPPSTKQRSGVDRTDTSARDIRIKRLTLDLPEELHRVLKVQAANDGVTMADKLRALLMEHFGLGGHDDAK